MNIHIDIYLAAYIAAVLLVLVALFVERGILRISAVVAGSAAIWLPFVMLKASLGLPSTDPIAGAYQLWGRKLDLPSRRVYLMVDDYEGKMTVPRLFSLPFEAENRTIDIEKNTGPYQRLDVTIDDEGGARLRYKKDRPRMPDPDKDRWYAEHRSRLGLIDETVAPPPDDTGTLLGPLRRR